MTTIAVHNGVMAADSAVSEMSPEGRFHSFTRSKIHDLGHGWLGAFSGDLALGLLLAESMYGMIQEAPSVKIADMSDELEGSDSAMPVDVKGLIGHATHGVFYIEVTPAGSVVSFQVPNGEPAAIGSGAAFALAAMDAGATAHQAVEIAVKRDFYSRHPVESVRMDSPMVNPIGSA